MPNPSSDFLKFANTPFESWILPIIPAKATLKPREDGKPGIAPKRLGKIPGKYVARAGAWAGFNWQDHRTTKDDLKQWQGWQTPDVPIAIGMRTAEFPVVDIDSLPGFEAPIKAAAVVRTVRAQFFKRSDLSQSERVSRRFFTSDDALPRRRPIWR